MEVGQKLPITSLYTHCVYTTHNQINDIINNNKMKNKKLKINKNVKKLLYLTKTRSGTYELLNELQYEKKLIYG